MESDVALLVLRVAIGTIFVAHGLQKLLGWWEGPGWEGWKGFIGFLGLRPAPLWASISLVAELGGGLALIAGLLVPLAAAGRVEHQECGDDLRSVAQSTGRWTRDPQQHRPVVATCAG